MKNNDLERIFDDACGNIPLKEPRDLWPGVSAGIKRSKANNAPVKVLWAAGFAAAAVLVVLSIPGAAESIKDGIKRMFSSAYSVQIGDSAPASGMLVSADGEMREIRAGDMLLEIRVTSMDEKTAKIQASVFYTGKLANGAERKLMSRPTIVALKGHPAEITVTNSMGVPIYKFKMTPTEQDPASYTGALAPIPSASVERK